MRRLLFALSAVLFCGSLLGAGAVLHQEYSRRLGAVSGLPDPGLPARPQGWAVNVALEQYDRAGRERALGQLRAFAWLRQTFPWDKIEPAPGEFAWEPWDDIVAQASAEGKRLIAVLNFTPHWAAGGTVGRTGPPVSGDDFARFAAAFAARYAGQIDVYQVWDEPNLASGWGGAPPSAAGYAALLQAAYGAIHAADPQATVLAAALAPTLENGPDNYSDLAYLQQIYDLGAGPYFDAAAGKPYGFYTGPDDRQADPARLNFSRFTLLRRVMERNGDGRKLLWGGNFGWNTRPDSLWGQAAPEAQASHTLAAYQRAGDEWPWAGPLALESYQPDSAPDDPRWGFALAGPAGELTALGRALAEAPQEVTAWPGNHAALHPAARYSGAWTFSDLGADIPEAYADARLELRFRGSELALRVRRGNYRAYLYVEVDGRPANRLPRDDRGAYLVLTAPDLQPGVDIILVASGLDPGATHTAVIRPERGWGQWALAGFSVGRRVADPALAPALAGLVAAGLAGLAGMWRWGGLAWGLSRAWQAAGSVGQLGLTALAGAVLYLSSWLAFGQDALAVSRRFGDALPIAITAATAGLFYFSPSFLVTVASLSALAVLFYLRLDLALAFTALFIPFYLQPRLLWERGFALVEVTTLLAFGAWAVRQAGAWAAQRRQSSSPAADTSAGLSSPDASAHPPAAPQDKGRNLGVPVPLSPAHPSIRESAGPRRGQSAIDLALLALLAAATFSLFTAEIKGVALREYRLVVVEPLAFYFLLRRAPLDRAGLWRLVDFFLMGAVVVAAIGLLQSATGSGLITAEGGVQRIRSLYGSPNNLALYLGRALPLAAAVGLMGRHRARRWLYAAAAVILLAALGLTLSKGALFLGVPAALAVIIIVWQGRRGAILVAIGATAGVAALPLLARLPRFASLLGEGGTSFFRLKLWVSAWRMFLDHPWLGVGLDNFLYQYRGRYILPEAWQEPNLSHPHNVALDFLSRLGLAGFGAGLWLAVGYGRAAWRALRQLRARLDEADLLALCAGLLGLGADMLAHGMVDNSLFLPDLAYAFCLALALVQRLPDTRDGA